MPARSCRKSMCLRSPSLCLAANSFFQLFGSSRTIVGGRFRVSELRWVRRLSSLSRAGFRSLRSINTLNATGSRGNGLIFLWQGSENSITSICRSWRRNLGDDGGKCSRRNNAGALAPAYFYFRYFSISSGGVGTYGPSEASILARHRAIRTSIAFRAFAICCSGVSPYAFIHASLIWDSLRAQLAYLSGGVDGLSLPLPSAMNMKASTAIRNAAFSKRVNLGLWIVALVILIPLRIRNRDRDIDLLDAQMVNEWL